MTSTTEKVRRAFGDTGLSVSPLGFGGSPIGVLNAAPDDATRVLNLLLDQGVNVVDTAACYYGSERLIGEAVGHRRDDFVLISKCGHERAAARGDNDFTPGVIAANIDESLRRLRTDHIDVMLLHTCDLETLQRGDALEAILCARDEGKVRFVGYSGDNEAAVWATTIEDIAVIQTSVNFCDQRNIHAVLPRARANAIGVMAKRPVANAAWKNAEQQYDRYRNYVKPYEERFAGMNLSIESLGFEGDPPSIWPEIALRFTLSIPGVHTAITGTTSVDHAMENLRFAAKGPLPDDAVATLRRAFAAADPGDWLGLT